MRSAVRGLIVAAILLNPIGLGAAPARTLVGRAHVLDGDTISVDGVHVRLQGLAAPELKEAGGQNARRFMTDLIEGRTVTCQLTGERSYERLVGICFYRQQDVAQQLVEAGLGRDCPRFSGGRYALAEVDASKHLPFPSYCTDER